MGTYVLKRSLLMIPTIFGIIKIVNDISKRNADQMYYVPTILSTSFAVIQPEVQGFALGSPSGQGSETFENIWLKKS